MDMELHLQREWSSLPLWVKDELVNAPKDYFFYKWEISRLVEHGENMRAVWKLFESNGATIRRKSSIIRLLSLLRQAKNGTDLGFERADADRRAIAADVRKHVEALLKLVHRLSTGSLLGAYPLGVTNALETIAHEVATDRVGDHFGAEVNAILARMTDAGISSDDRKSIAGSLEYLQGEIEREAMNLVSDPSISLGALADATTKWAQEYGWGRNDVIWYIGGALKDWFGCNQYSATATLASAILDEEISVRSVDGILVRRATAASGKVNPANKKRLDRNEDDRRRVAA